MKVRTDAEVRAYVGENEAHLAPILLFELADEGRPAAAMGRAAEAGGLRAAFARWAARLAVDRR